MTWSKIATSHAYVLAHRGGQQNDKVLVSINSAANCVLDAQDALSLGQYLTEKAGEILAESLV